MNCITDENVQLVLYADDTNIFIVGENKINLIHKANEILEQINDFMKSNLLHINLKKCCYMHFNPTFKTDFNTDQNHSNIDHDLSINVNICGTPISEVSSSKFLGVIIDNQLSWLPQIENLHKKLKSSTGMLKRICKNIPEENYKSIYYALFESHLSYCITVFGHVRKSKSKKLFSVQKLCIRILFGHQNAYLDKFKTCSRARALGNQKLGPEFFCKEHTKPLFHKMEI